MQAFGRLVQFFNESIVRFFRRHGSPQSADQPVSLQQVPVASNLEDLSRCDEHNLIHVRLNLHAHFYETREEKIPTVLARGDNDSCDAALSATGGCDPLFYKSCS